MRLFVYAKYRSVRRGIAEAFSSELPPSMGNLRPRVVPAHTVRRPSAPAVLGPPPKHIGRRAASRRSRGVHDAVAQGQDAGYAEISHGGTPMLEHISTLSGDFRRVQGSWPHQPA
jgi:hypothetical protein